MINTSLKPIARHIGMVASPKLKIEIQVFDSPVAESEAYQIHSIITIKEESNGDYNKLYGHLVYEAMLTEEQAKEAIENIQKNPQAFKNS